MLAACLLAGFSLRAQPAVPTVGELDLDAFPNHSVHHLWLQLIDDGLSQPLSVPVIVVKGRSTHPVLGLVAAIHGNEVNGIPIIQRVVEQIDPDTLRGTVLAIPGLNAVSLRMHQRLFFDDEDLNRLFPGKADGNRSQQYVWAINQKILTRLDYLIDMHTASFGRENTLYVRGDLTNEAIAEMAFLQDADIVLNSKGPSAGASAADGRTMRAEAMLKDIPTITVEYGNPQVYQEEMIRRGATGVQNVMVWLGMVKGAIRERPRPVVCRKSYWVYVDKGGYLEVPVALNQLVSKGEVIGILRNPFGDSIRTYRCPEDGIVIGKSSNPVNMSGGRIIHLGILDETRN